MLRNSALECTWRSSSKELGRQSVFVFRNILQAQAAVWRDGGETLGLLYALRRHRRHLENGRIEILTDCSHLVKALSGIDPPTDARWERVFADLLTFSFALTQVAGEKHVMAH